jgi:hypothetical protein
VTDEYERVVTHRKLAPVARLMGYTTQGLRELCRLCGVGYEWRTIGITRPRFNQPIERVNARAVRANGNGPSRKYEFSIGTEAFALTESAAEQQRIRNEVADAVVKRISAQRPSLNPRFIKANLDHQPVNDQGSADALSRPETMIISPVAPRDPRAVNACERPVSGSGNGMSAP